MEIKNNTELREYIIQKFMGSQLSIKGSPKIDSFPIINVTPPKSYLPKEGEKQDISDSDSDSSNDMNNTFNYKYLHDNPLSREFNYKRDYTKLYKISLCLYKINTDSRTLFLEYLFVKKDGNYQFPQADLIMSNFTQMLTPPSMQIMPTDNLTDADDNTDDTDDETELLNQCSQLFNKITSLTLDKTMYQGFLEDDSNIFIFLNYTDAESDIEITESKWAILDEIVTKRSILDIPIITSNYELFYKNLILLQLFDYNNQEIIKPIAAYLCETKPNETDDYNNVYYAETENNLSTTSLIQPKIDHPIFGDVYLFSNNQLNYTNLNKIKRFALFIDSAVYILNKNIPINELLSIADTDTDTATNQFDEIIVISFYKNENLLFCVREVDLFIEL